MGGLEKGMRCFPILTSLSHYLVPMRLFSPPLHTRTLPFSRSVRWALGFFWCEERVLCHWWNDPFSFQSLKNIIIIIYFFPFRAAPFCICVSRQQRGGKQLLVEVFSANEPRIFPPLSHISFFSSDPFFPASFFFFLYLRELQTTSSRNPQKKF